MRLGTNMKAALEFATRNYGWHEYANDRATVGAINRLAALGLVDVNEFHQFRRTA